MAGALGHGRQDVIRAALEDGQKDKRGQHRQSEQHIGVRGGDALDSGVNDLAGQGQREQIAGPGQDV